MEGKDGRKGWFDKQIRDGGRGTVFQCKSVVLPFLGRVHQLVKTLQQLCIAIRQTFLSCVWLFDQEREGERGKTNLELAIVDGAESEGETRDGSRKEGSKDGKERVVVAQFKEFVGMTNILGDMFCSFNKTRMPQDHRRDPSGEFVEASDETDDVV